MQPITLETPRLFLRQWKDSDYAPFAALHADPFVMEHFPFMLSCEQSDAFANKARQGIEEKGWGLWAVECKENGEFIGMVGLQPVSDFLPFAPAVEVLWRLAYPYWGRGYATEAANACIDFAFQTLGEDHVVAFTALKNSRSEAVMKRLAMEYHGVFDHPQLPDGHPSKPHHLYIARKKA